jgi:hypothetical protein
MHQASRGHDGDDTRPQRHPVIDEDDVGTLAGGENAAIGEAGGAGGG